MTGEVESAEVALTYTVPEGVESGDGKYLTFSDPNIMRLIEEDEVFSSAIFRLAPNSGLNWIMIPKEKLDVFKLLLNKYAAELIKP